MSQVTMVVAQGILKGQGYTDNEVRQLAHHFISAQLRNAAPVQEPEKLNPLTQLQVAYVMGLRDAQPRKAVKLSDSEILAALEVEYVSSAQNRHLFLSDARTIEAAVWAKLGVEK